MLLAEEQELEEKRLIAIKEGGGSPYDDAKEMQKQPGK